MFSDLAELHRTFTVPVKDLGPVRRQDELEKEAVRLKEHLHVSASPRKYGRRSTVFSAVELNGSNLGPVDIWESWDAQDFARYATNFEEENSILCDPASYRLAHTVLSGGPGQLFAPIVQNTGSLCFLVVGHTGIVMGDRVIVPHSLAARSGGDPEAAMSTGIPLYVTKDHTRPPDEWLQLGVPDISYRVVVTPDGRVTRLQKYSSRGVASANWIIDIVVAPAVIAMTKSGARMAMSLMESMPVGRTPMLAGPTRELAKEAAAAAELSAARLAGRTSPGMAVSTGGVLPVEHLGRRTLIMGDDLPKFRGLMARSHSESGFYDVVIHGNSTSFQILIKANGKEVWKEVSVRDIANVIRPQLAPGDKIRLLACDVGKSGGPAQQLANELGRTVWAPSTKLDAVPALTVGGRASFVPGGGGKFYEFVPH